MKLKNIILVLLLAGFVTGATVKAGSAGENPNDKAVIQQVEWLSYDEGLSKAKKEGKHLFIDFTAKWCGYCKRMDKTTFVEPEIVEMLNNDFVAVRVDGDSNKELDIEGYKISEKNLTRQEYGIRGYPTFWFVDSDGTKLGAVSGFQPATNLKSYLQYVKDKKYEEEKQADNNNNDEKK